MRYFGVFEWKGECAIEDETWREGLPENSSEFTLAELLHRPDGERLLAEWRAGDDSRMQRLIAALVADSQAQDEAVHKEIEALRKNGATEEEVFAHVDREFRNTAASE